MSTSAPEQPRATNVEVADDMLVVHLEDGREVRVPVEWFPRLRDATAKQRSNWQMVGRGIGIHWPDVDEDISVRGLLLPESALPNARKTA